MKWIRKDYKGNPQIWYSGDVIEKIKEKSQEYSKKQNFDPFAEWILSFLSEVDYENQRQ
jgi:hypothetical protein